MSDLEFEDEDYSPSPSAPASPSLDLVIGADQAGMRLDQALAQALPDVSRSRLVQLIKSGHIAVAGQVATPKLRLIGVERISVQLPPRDEDTAFAPEAIPLNVLHEDDAVLVLDKPPGLVVHPAAGNWHGTVLNGLLHRDPALARVPRAGIVHRLDKDTSGLMVVARTETAQVDLVRQLQARTVRREYVALAQGRLLHPVRIDAPIGRHPRQRTKMAIVSEGRGGKPAATRVSILEELPCHTLVECRLESGRTHQIRVHMQSIGHSLEGDSVYGAKAWPRHSVWEAAVSRFARQALHARRLAFNHPLTGHEIEFESPLPKDMEDLIEIMRDGPK